MRFLLFLVAAAAAMDIEEMIDILDPSRARERFPAAIDQPTHEACAAVGELLLEASAACAQVLERPRAVTKPPIAVRLVGISRRFVEQALENPADRSGMAIIQHVMVVIQALKAAPEIEDLLSEEMHEFCDAVDEFLLGRADEETTLHKLVF